MPAMTPWSNEDLTPEGWAKALVLLLTHHGFSDATTPKNLHSDRTRYREIMDHDRLLAEEVLVDAALRIEQPID